MHASPKEGALCPGWAQPEKASCWRPRTCRHTSRPRGGRCRRRVEQRRLPTRIVAVRSLLWRMVRQVVAVGLLHTGSPTTRCWTKPPSSRARPERPGVLPRGQAEHQRPSNARLRRSRRVGLVLPHPQRRAGQRDPPGARHELLREGAPIAAGIMDDATDPVVKLDGVSLPTKNFRFTAGVLHHHAIEQPGAGGGCNDPAGTYGPAVGDGYYIMLRPLSRWSPHAEVQRRARPSASLWTSRTTWTSIEAGQQESVAERRKQ